MRLPPGGRERNHGAYPAPDPDLYYLGLPSPDPGFFGGYAPPHPRVLFARAKSTQKHAKTKVLESVVQSVTIRI